MNKDKPERILFKSADDWHHNACLNWASWEIYAGGYKEAADKLVASAKADRQDLDILIYPMVFLYRHWIELRLKEVIGQGGILVDDLESAPHSHDLVLLWSQARGVIERIWPEGDSAGLDDAESTITEFSAVDPKSMTFRYIRDRKGQISMPEDITHINVRHLGDKMQSLAEYLDGAAWGIDHILGEIDL